MIKLINIPKITDVRGNLGVVEKDLIPFTIKRVYYLYDVPSTAYRGGHSHIDQTELLIPLSGSFEVVLDNGKEKQIILLNKPDKGLIINTGIWRELQNFSSGAVCLVLSSGEFDEADYIRSYQDFVASKNS